MKTKIKKPKPNVVNFQDLKAKDYFMRDGRNSSLVFVKIKELDVAGRARNAFSLEDSCLWTFHDYSKVIKVLQEKPTCFIQV